jgi:hypothetical protein
MFSADCVAYRPFSTCKENISAVEISWGTAKLPKTPLGRSFQVPSGSYAGSNLTEPDDIRLHSQ